MTFEFLIACNIPLYNDIEDAREFLADVLNQVLDYSQIDFDDSMIQIRNQRPVNGGPADDGNTLIGFTLELPEDASDIETVVSDFAEDLKDRPPVLHIVKFEDPLLQAELSERAAEIFALEMKLRRVLSFIYLYAYQLRDPFDLLREDHVQIVQKEKPTEQEMKESSENQFFHLTFSQYINLNQRRQLNQKDLLDIIRDAEQYDALRYAIIRNPIENERDTDLLNNLKALMDPIERMRNCVAHNRRPIQRIADNYHNAYPHLEELLDSYLADLTT